MIIASGIAAALLAIIHLLASNLKHLHGIPRSRWLSMAGGASVGYVFMHILPELQEWQELFNEEVSFLPFLNHHLYLIALLGLSIFYGLERSAKLSEDSYREHGKEGKSLGDVYRIHMVIFAIYNALIGYLLINRDVGGLTELILFSIAMALHFMVNDYGLLDHYKMRYIKKGRWVLAGSILAGWGLGVLTDVPEYVVAILFAFLSGAIILNILKEELPEERKSRYWAFLLGAVIYAGLVVIS